MLNGSDLSPLQLAGHATRGAPDSFPLLLPHHRRIDRQVEQRDVVRQGIVEDGGHDVRRQHGQVDHPADVAVVHALTVSQFPHSFHLAGF